MGLIDFLFRIFLICVWIGFLVTVIDALRKKEYKPVIKMVVIPFYVFHHIFQLPESNQKKILGILTIGCFWLVLFLGILKIVFTPPI